MSSKAHSNPRGRRKGWISLYEAQGTGGNAFILVDNDTGDEQIVQTDWEFPGLASTFGWVPCKKCRATDGTVDCKHKTASQMISEAYDYLMAHQGKQVPDPGYFNVEPSGEGRPMGCYRNPAPTGRRRNPEDIAPETPHEEGWNEGYFYGTKVTAPAWFKGRERDEFLRGVKDGAAHHEWEKSQSEMETNPAPSGRRRDYRRNPEDWLGHPEYTRGHQVGYKDVMAGENFQLSGRGSDPFAIGYRDGYIAGYRDLLAGKNMPRPRIGPASNPGRARRNPDYSNIRGFEPWMAQNPQFVQAVEKYREFHGCMPVSISKKDLPGLGAGDDTQFLVHMGKAMDTTYRPTHRKSSKYGSAYIHEFGEGLGRKPKDEDLPDQVCTPDGKNILTFGGKFEVKDWVRR